MNRIRELREELNMMQKDLAVLIGCAANTLSYYEKGEHALTPDTIRRLCEIFHVSADYLLGFSSRRTPEISPEDAELLAAYHDAPEEIRAIIDTALEPYKEKRQTAAG